MVLIALSVSIVTLRYTSSKNKLSLDDYRSIAEKSELILAAAGGTSSEKNEYCSYETREKYDKIRLYCYIEMASFLEYKNDEQAAAVGRKFAQSISSNFGDYTYGLSKFYNQPHDGYGVISAKLSKPHKGSCNFYIDTNKFAKDAVSFVPKKTSDNLIALSLMCVGESEEEYFPVTYRQGQN